MKFIVSDLNNYRGISILPPLNKIFEKILATQIRNYLNLIICFGSTWIQKSTLMWISFTWNHSACFENRDNKLITLLCFIEFKKAFDMVEPNLLLIKLLNYGFSKKVAKLLTDYFKNRKIQSKVGDTFSDFISLILGVPQGSILGPLLFIIFINDIYIMLDALVKFSNSNT